MEVLDDMRLQQLDIFAMLLALRNGRRDSGLFHVNERGWGSQTNRDAEEFGRNGNTLHFCIGDAVFQRRKQFGVQVLLERDL